MAARSLRSRRVSAAMAITELRIDTIVAMVGDEVLLIRDVAHDCLRFSTVDFMIC